MGARGPKRNKAQVPLDDTRKQVFLDALRSTGGCFSAACRIASPHSDNPNHPACYSTFKAAIRRDVAFASDVAAVYDMVREDVSAEIYRRGQVGWDEPVFGKGERIIDHDGKPATIRKFSDRLLELRARAVDPAYADRKSVHVTGTVHHDAGGYWSISREDLRHLTDDQAGQLANLMGAIRDGRAAESGEVAAIEHKPAEVLQVPGKVIEGEAVEVVASPVVKGSIIERDYVADAETEFPAWED